MANDDFIFGPSKQVGAGIATSGAASVITQGTAGLPKPFQQNKDPFAREKLRMLKEKHQLDMESSRADLLIKEESLMTSQLADLKKMSASFQGKLDRCCY